MADSQETTASPATTTPTTPPQPLPRIAIQFCTQCKWMLRAAYFAQELLSTFSTSLGEVALIPATGGIFTVTITTPSTTSSTSTETKLLWDRKTGGGFPETKELKRRVRDVIDPGRDLGHVDRHNKPAPAPPAAEMPSSDTTSLNLTKHPAGPVSSTSGDAPAPSPASSTPIYNQSCIDDDTVARVAQAKANKGQQNPNTVDGATLKAQLGKSATTEKACEDCA
ncbi:selT/selW/selH seleno protein domain-containing protein [Plectosphaerella cucumerina]|uniref:SelT/selW/selH seleno protein domain-containing protein n=1 Tax=Plectosphaerella cucumerina TaxID=40658 RepID=A0A8K0X099_9PEZI|nr:selT/selW/selH seleno protein domain-containing protein [Plectosphaerella cucumerina]